MRRIQPLPMACSLLPGAFACTDDSISSNGTPHSTMDNLDSKVSSCGW